LNDRWRIFHFGINVFQLGATDVRKYSLQDMTCYIQFCVCVFVFRFSATTAAETSERIIPEALLIGSSPTPVN
jgi:hypothetical protein